MRRPDPVAKGVSSVLSGDAKSVLTVSVVKVSAGSGETEAWLKSVVSQNSLGCETAQVKCTARLMIPT